MVTIGYILKHIREDKNISLEQLGILTGVNTCLIQEFENGRRTPTIEQVIMLTNACGIDKQTSVFLNQQRDILIGDNMTNTEKSPITKSMFDANIAYGSPYLSLFMEAIYFKPIPLESRRYIGSKTKLINWIMDTIKKETVNVHSFFDVFAGTGVVTKAALKTFDHVFTNDFLHSNNLIYKAFFGNGEYDQLKICDFIDRYNAIDSSTLSDNYFSLNFGDKYFEYDVAKLIGYIRQDIEDKKNNLTDKEYSILIATLIYNIDRLANTVGHFEAYIKKPIKHQPLKLRMIEAEAYENIEIFKQDSNALARTITADVAYIDPPYNSRQYCRFYHVYETLVKWDMPQLYGVAMKPAPENMSRYCTSRAVDAFEDLISNLNAKYIVVSYNNTYNSKSSSSENKITIEQITRILEKCGNTNFYECSHRFFNAGKTDFNNHKELLFITNVDEDRKRKSFTSLLCR